MKNSIPRELKGSCGMYAHTHTRRDTPPETHIPHRLLPSSSPSLSLSPVRKWKRFKLTTHCASTRSVSINVFALKSVLLYAEFIRRQCEILFGNNIKIAVNFISFQSFSCFDFGFTGQFHSKPSCVIKPQRSRPFYDEPPPYSYLPFPYYDNCQAIESHASHFRSTVS